MLVALAIGVMVARDDPSDTLFIIATGALGSLVTSFVLLGVDLLLTDDADAPAERLAQRLDGQLTRLGRVIPVVADAEAHGVHTVKPKGMYKREEWEAILQGARDRLLLVGHALDKWCTEDLEPLFAATLARLAREGKQIRLLTLSRDTQEEHRGRDHRERVETTLRVLAKVDAQLTPRQRTRLEVRALDAELTMPYMVVENGAVLVTSSYPATEHGSGRMLAVTIDTLTPFGVSLRNDVKQLFERHARPVDLEPYRAS